MIIQISKNYNIAKLFLTRVEAETDNKMNTTHLLYVFKLSNVILNNMGINKSQWKLEYIFNLMIIKGHLYQNL
jgi:hypothetical protein